MKRLIGLFLKGLLVFVPAAITVLIVVVAIKNSMLLLNFPIPEWGCL
jgi:uncharacterized membrane protein